MNKKIKLNGKEILLKIKESSVAKRIRIDINMIDGIKIVKPKSITSEQLNVFIRLKSNWIFKKYIKFEELFKNNNFSTRSNEHFEEYKNKALRFCKNRVDYWNKDKKYNFKEIKVKKLKTKWGSCTTNKNLNFNYKIMFLPKKEADRIIVHELCHLKEMNHSKKFWNLVNKTLNK